jgi:soluble lytic murein transglycosylase-like protein
MKRIALAFSIIALVSIAARAQQRPLSPPDQPPVPLKVDEKAPAARPDPGKKAEVTGAPAKAPESAKILVPVDAGHHISSGNAALDALVREAASRSGLDPCLIISVMRAESGFNRMAVSPKGASGLMQLMPATAARFGVRNIFDPRENVLAGSTYLRWLLERFNGDVRLALAGYNAGEGAVEMYGNRIPPFHETQNYVRMIYGRYSTLHLGRGVPVPARPATAEAAPAPQPARESFPTYNQVIKFTSSSGDRSGK